MNTQIRCAQVICTALLVSGMSASARLAARAHTAESKNAALIEQAFEDGEQGLRDIIDLLTPAAQWTVAGARPITGTYLTRAAFLTQALGPVMVGLGSPITPHIKKIVAQGDHVVVLWEGAATLADGRHYENSYAWHLQMHGGSITQITAFPDAERLVDPLH